MNRHCLVATALLLEAACVPQPRMCASDADCGGRASCVAGRCVAQGATAAIDNGRRLLFAPVDAAFVPHADSSGRDVDVATLGRARDGGALALLRFAVRLPPEATLLEAYVILERVADADSDPAPIDLHAARVVDPWDGASVSWARPPRVEEVGAPVTRVSPGSGPLVRLEVGQLVQRWRRRGRDDFGVAIVGDGTSATGVSFAWAPRSTAPDWRDPILDVSDSRMAPVEPASPFEPGPPARAMTREVGEPRVQLVGPRLELYVR